MKATLKTTLFYLLFLLESTAAAERQRLGTITDRVSDTIPVLPTSTSSNTSNDDKRVESPNVFSGRTGATTLCGPGSGATKHHETPCDENVQSNGDDSDSISTRKDRETQAPETQVPETQAPESCLSKNGVYGDVDGVGFPVDYLYEMQTVSGTDATEISSDILPDLEKAIVDSILHELFPSKCAATAIGKRSLNDGQLEAIGVAMNPPDSVTTNSCNFLTPEDSLTKCFVVKGELTVYLNEDVEEEQKIEEQENIRSVIKTNMNDKNYDSAHGDIIELRYLDKLDPSESNTSNGEDGDGQIQQRRNRNLRMGLFVGIGTLGAVLAGVLFRLSRRMRNPDDQTELQTGMTQTYLDVEEQRPSFS